MKRLPFTIIQEEITIETNPSYSGEIKENDGMITKEIIPYNMMLPYSAY